MRVAVKLLSLPLVLLAASRIGVIGQWGMPVGAILLLVACVSAAVAMESRDLASVEGLSPSTEPVSDQLLDAA